MNDDDCFFLFVITTRSQNAQNTPVTSTRTKRMTMVLSPQVAMALLQNHPSLPDVRRKALVESVRRASDPDQVFDMLLDSASSSPYLSDEQKQEMANAFLSGDLNVSSTSTLPTMDAPFHGMVEMVRLMLSTSRKLLSLPMDRRRHITMAVHQTCDEDQLLDLVLQKLPTALSLDRDERQLVANDILDHRYYRLLLPNRFDCNEPLPRIGESQQTECPICFDECDSARSHVLQCCGQRFCSSCVSDLTTIHATCPLCRQSLPPAMAVPTMEAAATGPSRPRGRRPMFRPWLGSERNVNI